MALDILEARQGSVSPIAGCTSYNENHVINCLLAYEVGSKPACYDFSNVPCCTSWLSAEYSYLSCLETVMGNCFDYAEQGSIVSIVYPCYTDHPLTAPRSIAAATTPVPSVVHSAVSTTDTLYSTPALVPSLVLTAVSTTDILYSTPTHSAIPTWSGSGNLLQGYCATPQYVILDGPTAYWAPIVGCAAGKSDCCPYSVAGISSPTVVTVVSTVTVNIEPSGTPQPYANGLQGYPVAVIPNQATLAHCPDDYVKISSGCCPSGYQLWNAPLGGQVPCYSLLNSYLVPPAIDIPNTPSPSIASTISAASSTASSTTTHNPTSAIINIVYAIQFPVQPSSGLSTSAKAGICARASVGSLVIICLAYFLW